jgi:hypothetical protein
MAIDDKTRTELEAAVFRRLVEHLRSRTDVQNIDLMNLAGFCRNCLSNWLKDEADAKGVGMSKDESREAVYGMPYETWKSTYQGTAAASARDSRHGSHAARNSRNSSFFILRKGDFAISCGRAVDERAVALTQVVPLTRVIPGCGAWRSVGAFRF